ncbi:MAG: hypothetical protein [Caudoviricetes sp.]|nr:MAG: hypothetical protein [Caudoviricetes sp.]
MIRDILDILNPHTQFTLSGTYYPERPDGPDVGGQQFNYEYVDPTTHTWRTLFGNIQVSAGETAIRTDDQLSFKEGKGLVNLQDGSWYTIEQKATDYQSAPKQAFRVLPVPVGTQFVLRLVATEEPWGIT